jgi:hypothetical protein
MLPAIKSIKIQLATKIDMSSLKEIVDDILEKRDGMTSFIINDVDFKKNDD